jgi:hypothetical protein
VTEGRLMIFFLTAAYIGLVIGFLILNSDDYECRVRFLIRLFLFFLLVYAGRTQKVGTVSVCPSIFPLTCLSIYLQYFSAFLQDVAHYSGLLNFLDLDLEL